MACVLVWPCCHGGSAWFWTAAATVRWAKARYQCTIACTYCSGKRELAGSWAGVYYARMVLQLPVQAVCPLQCLYIHVGLRCLCKGRVVVCVRRCACYAMKAADACASAVGGAVAQTAPTQLACRSRLPACTSMHGSAVHLCLIGSACHLMQVYEVISCGSLAAWQMPLNVEPSCGCVDRVCMVLTITQCVICFTSRCPGAHIVRQEQQQQCSCRERCCQAASQAFVKCSSAVYRVC